MTKGQREHCRLNGTVLINAGIWQPFELGWSSTLSCGCQMLPGDTSPSWVNFISSTVTRQCSMASVLCCPVCCEYRMFFQEYQVSSKPIVNKALSVPFNCTCPKAGQTRLTFSPLSSAERRNLSDGVIVNNPAHWPILSLTVVHFDQLFSQPNSQVVSIVHTSPSVYWIGSVSWLDCLGWTEVNDPRSRESLSRTCIWQVQCTMSQIFKLTVQLQMSWHQVNFSNIEDCNSDEYTIFTDLRIQFILWEICFVLDS